MERLRREAELTYNLDMRLLMTEISRQEEMGIIQSTGKEMRTGGGHYF